jgi:hypothetical protein
MVSGTPSAQSKTGMAISPLLMEIECLLATNCSHRPSRSFVKSEPHPLQHEAQELSTLMEHWLKRLRSPRERKQED